MDEFLIFKSVLIEIDIQILMKNNLGKDLIIQLDNKITVTWGKPSIFVSTKTLMLLIQQEHRVFYNPNVYNLVLLNLTD